MAGGKVTITAGSFLQGPGCSMHGNEGIDLTVGKGINYGSITAGSNTSSEPCNSETYNREKCITFLLDTFEKIDKLKETTSQKTVSTSISESFTSISEATSTSLTNSGLGLADTLPVLLTILLFHLLVKRFYH